MSRVARIPVSLAKGVEAQISAGQITVKGPMGTLKRELGSQVEIKIADGKVSFAAADESRHAKAMSGTMRALVAGMVEGVSKGFERKLTLVFSHPVVHLMPAGVKVETPTQTEILVKGADKQRVGQVAAEIRAYRPPEPYKGKGVRYADEIVVLKETKKK
jgi:large subunit ribosomal protein L6